MLRKPAFLLFALALNTSLLLSQSANVAGGGNSASASGSVSFSVGQVVCSTNSGASGTIIMGVQQPYEISVVTVTREASGITLECTLYPNPVSDFLTLKIHNFDFKAISFKIFNINGELLKENKILDEITFIQMSELKTGTYFIRIINNVTEIKTFKIIKN